MTYTRYFRHFVYEFVCTAILVAVTCLAHTKLRNALLEMSVAYGAINLVLAVLFGRLSGGYANPSVVLALWWRGCMSISKLLTYFVAEITGGAAGHYLVHKLQSKSPDDLTCVFDNTGEMSQNGILATEFLLTFLLVFTWCVLWDYEGEFRMEFYIGGANALVYFLGAYMTGGCTNPARTVAPMYFQFKTAPITKMIIGAQLAAGLAAPFLWGCLEFWAKL